MKTALQVCTESYFRHAYGVRRQGKRDKTVVQSLVIIAHMPSNKIGRAALKVLTEVRLTPTREIGGAA